MVAAQDIPLAVPLLFLGLGVFLLIVNRRAFTDPDGELHRMAEKRARSKVVGILGGSGDATKEYERLRKSRWLFPVTAVGYFVLVAWALVVAIIR